MISIKPKWVKKILMGEKTIEVRKNKGLANAIQKLIEQYGFADIYMYCTKEAEMFRDWATQKWYVFKNRRNVKKLSNGVVKAKFRCYKVEEIENHILHDYMETKSLSCVELKKRSCLDLGDLYKYLDIDNGYAIYISDLEIFDRPKELSEFKQPRDSYGKVNWNANEYYYMELTKAPQSFCYIETEE